MHENWQGKYYTDQNVHVEGIQHSQTSTTRIPNVFIG